jgi:hypothetical protein
MSFEFDVDHPLLAKAKELRNAFHRDAVEPDEQALRPFKSRSRDPNALPIKQGPYRMANAKNPYYQGPVTDHFEGTRVLTPMASNPRLAGAPALAVQRRASALAEGGAEPVAAGQARTTPVGR